MRLIDADKFKQNVISKFRCVPLVGTCMRDNELFTTILDEQPTVDVEPVRHGRWEHSYTETGFAVVKCSCCGHEAFAIAEYVIYGNYCPHCGTKMDGELTYEDD